MVLPLPDLECYARQIILPEIGEARQDKLLCSSVLLSVWEDSVHLWPIIWLLPESVGLGSLIGTRLTFQI